MLGWFGLWVFGWLLLCFLFGFGPWLVCAWFGVSFGDGCGFLWI